MPPLEDADDKQYPIEGELLVAKRALSGAVERRR